MAKKRGLEAVVKEYVRRRTERVIQDADNSTSVEEEVKGLVETIAGYLPREVMEADIEQWKKEDTEDEEDDEYDDEYDENNN